MGRAVSLLREFRVAAAPARHAIAVSREEHPRAALRTVCSLPCDPVAVNLVELPLEAGRAFLLLRFGHHFASFFLPSGFLSAFFSSLFSSFFSAGFFSSFSAGLFFSLPPALFRFWFRLASSLRAPALCAGAGGVSPFFSPRPRGGVSPLRAGPFFSFRFVSFFCARGLFCSLP